MDHARLSDMEVAAAQRPGYGAHLTVRISNPQGADRKSQVISHQLLSIF